MLGAEAFSERDIVGPALVALVGRKPGAERADVVLVERVARAEVVGDLLDQLIGDRPGAHEGPSLEPSGEGSGLEQLWKTHRPVAGGEARWSRESGC